MLRSLPSILLLAFLFSMHIGANAQEPTLVSLSSYGGDAADHFGSLVIPTKDGGFLSVLASTSKGTGNIGVFCSGTTNQNIFLKYNADASKVEWSRCFVATGDSQTSFIFETVDGGNVLFNLYNTTVSQGFYIWREDAQRNIIWKKNYGKGYGDILRDVLPSPDGGYFTLSQSFYVDSANVWIHHGSFLYGDYWLMKLDSNGNKLWSIVLGGSDDEMNGKLVKGPNGSVYMAGTSSSSDFDCIGNHGNMDGFVARVDDSGNVLWHKMIGGSSVDRINTACSNANEGILIGGTTLSDDGDVQHHIKGQNIWITDMDSNGNINWTTCYGGYSEYVNSIARADDNTIWIGGVSLGLAQDVREAFGRNDAYLIHTDASGNIIGTKVLGSSKDDEISVVYPLHGVCFVGGLFSNNNFSFSSLPFYDSSYSFDAFTARFFPWNTDVKRIQKTSDFTVSPNPANDQITINMSSPETCDVQITDALGKTLYRARCTEHCDVKVNDWAKGIYFISIQTSLGMKRNQKLLIE